MQYLYMLHIGHIAPIKTDINAPVSAECAYDRREIMAMVVVETIRRQV